MSRFTKTSLLYLTSLLKHATPSWLLQAIVYHKFNENPDLYKDKEGNS